MGMYEGCSGADLIRGHRTLAGRVSYLVAGVGWCEDLPPKLKTEYWESREAYFYEPTDAFRVDQVVGVDQIAGVDPSQERREFLYIATHTLHGHSIPRVLIRSDFARVSDSPTDNAIFRDNFELMVRAIESQMEYVEGAP
jgi:hypothetical protein